MKTKSLKYFISILIILTTSMSLASFDHNARQYMSYFDLINSFRNIFLSGVQTTYINNACQLLTEDYQADLGYNSPASGEALISTPNSGYIRWISGCVASYLNTLQYTKIKDVPVLSANSKKYFIEQSGSKDPSLYMIGQTFHELPEEVQDDLINYSFYVVFGPDETFNQFGLLKAQVFRNSLREHLLKKPVSTIKALEIIFLNYLTRDEFLSY